MVRAMVVTVMRWYMYAQYEGNQEESEHNEVDEWKKSFCFFFVILSLEWHCISIELVNYFHVPLFVHMARNLLSEDVCQTERKSGPIPYRVKTAEHIVKILSSRQLVFSELVDVTKLRRYHANEGIININYKWSFSEGSAMW